jgi:uncharacterized protein (UPF0332 family)
MDSMVKIYLQRARNELAAGKLLFDVSDNKEKKIEMHIEENMTFYSSTIAHSYYSIFFAAKAILLTKKIKTEAPEVHKKTFEAFKEHFVDSGVLDVELLTIYKKMIVKADELLEIFKDEKWKRGHFTYQTIPQANKEPAHQSMENAKKFLKNITAVIEN